MDTATKAATRVGWVYSMHHTTPFCISINQSTVVCELRIYRRPCVCVVVISTSGTLPTITLAAYRRTHGPREIIVCVVRTQRRSVPASLEGSSSSSGSSAQWYQSINQSISSRERLRAMHLRACMSVRGSGEDLVIYWRRRVVLHGYCGDLVFVRRRQA